ncbi:MAG: SDR family NAD(P)-dependent oxidoreductase [Myxococcales bacterium]|nr:SDR family NAD(P)-dependent oxidoreductase [Myxococcales bacterium]
MAWSEADIPSQAGRTALVTGGNGGLGLETARMLAAAGAHVVIAARNAAKAEGAVASIRASVPAAKLEVQPLDLSSLDSVKRLVAAWTEGGRSLDLLVNNAGIMAIPRALSADGFEMQLATNHLGHFALTLGLIPALLQTRAPRVVTVSSGTHWAGRLHEDDLDGARSYGPWEWYAQSKLCNLLFTSALDRRLRAAGSPLAALAAHPGYAATDLQQVAPRQSGSAAASAFMSLGNTLFAQSAAAGALPTVQAATDPNAEGGQYWGPRVLGWVGAPSLAARSSVAKDHALADRLWAISEARTGCRLGALTA